MSFTNEFMTHYVLGFMFDESNLNRVALIRKKRPDWQAGKLNGIGGKVEPWEDGSEAIVREFYEETGYRTTTCQWGRFAMLRGDGYRVEVFVSVGPLDRLKSTTDEEVVVFSKDCIDSGNSIPNLTWLVPMAALTLPNLHLNGKVPHLLISE